tara:strand:+ start:432 stop:737 length:306 start_codon:yes stop_codon:yes gene_type:complete
MNKMKEKFSIQNIIIIVLLITIVALLVEPKLKSNTISEISNEISTDSTTIDSLSMRDWLLNKGYSEKEIEILSGNQKLKSNKYLTLDSQSYFLPLKFPILD